MPQNRVRDTIMHVTLNTINSVIEWPYLYGEPQMSILEVAVTYYDTLIVNVIYK